MWTFRFEQRALKELRKLSKVDQQRVKEFIDGRLSELDNPRQLGGPLKGEMAEYWRYRIGHIRILCHIDDGELVVLVISVGNRREIYR